MASGKISPRQKMINMMYLVLTALLAMNVSSEILNAFKTVNRSLTKTISVLNDKNAATYDALKAAKEEPQTKEKALLWEPVALQIKAKSDELYSYLETNKADIIKAAGNKNGERAEDGELKFKEDDLDVSTRLLIEEKGGAKGKELHNKLLTYKKEILGILSSTAVPENQREALNQAVEGFNKSLPINLDIPKKDKYGKPYPQDATGWLRSNFYQTPAIASLTIFNKLQSDIRSSEGQLSDYCINQLGKVKFIYDKFAAVAAANTTYCMPGDPIEVSAGIGAFNDQAKPKISIGGAGIPLVDGMATKKMNAPTSPGEYSIPVNIQYTTPDGQTKTENRVIKYTVGQPSGAALMLDKMNVFYIGLPNPVTVSSGTGDEKTKLTASGGGVTLEKSAPGKYIVRATTVGESNITINADGKTTSYKFRVKTVPTPIATIGGTIKGGKIKSGVIAVQQGVVALLENFDFDVKFEVLGYEYIYKPNNGDLVSNKVVGPRFDGAVQGILKSAKSKDLFIIESVKVKGPDGATKVITGMSVQII